MRHLLSLIALSLLTTGAIAQELKLPSWMHGAVAKERTPAENAREDSIIYAALEVDPSILYAALGLDSISRNQFIGTWSARLTLKQEPKEDIVVNYSGWADTTQAILTINLFGKGEVTCLADLRANAVIMASSANDERKATVKSIQDLAYTNSMIIDANRKGESATATKRKRTLLEQVCTEHIARSGRDTTRYWVSNIKRSPFRDAVHWAPLTGPYMIFGQVSTVSEHMPLRMEEGKKLVFEVTAVKRGRQPRPAFDLSTYTVTDERKRNTKALALRKGPSPIWQPRKPRVSWLEESDGAHESVQEGMGPAEGDLPVPPPIAEEEDMIFNLQAVQEQPQFPGGVVAMQRYLAQNIRYPEMEEEAKIQGKVYVEFVVGKDGSIRDVRVRRGVSTGLDKETVRVIKTMPKWKPGTMGGKPVAVSMVFPVAFVLQ